MAEKRRFKLHEAMIYTTIYNQAGTLGKALLELVMNSIDAGATGVTIDLDAKTLTVVDDGRGFRNRQEIDEWFETFGTPHKEGDARYGRFRMGRGQIMAFASTRWRTGAFQMDVDFKNRGEEYDLDTDLEARPGCRIEGRLYEPLLPSDLAAVERELAEMAHYAEIDVVLNGKKVNALPTDEKWDFETDDAYIRLRQTGGLKVYNLGVLVREYPSYQYGTGGVVVSKRPLEVNGARNDVIIAKCPVWRRLRKYLQDGSNERNKRKPTLNDQERENLIAQLLAGELTYSEACDLKLVVDTQGKPHPLKRLERLVSYNGEVTVEPERGSRMAETVHMRKLAFVLSQRTLEMFRCESGEAFVSRLHEIARGRGWVSIHFVPFAGFQAVLNDGYEVLKDDELTKRELNVLRAVRNGQDYLLYALRRDGEFGVGSRNRKIHVGVSDTANAWTDGCTRIALERHTLKWANEGMQGFVRLARLLLHEYTHRESDAASHEHGLEFYEAFHNAAASPHNPLGVGAKSMFDAYLKILRAKGEKVNLTLLKDADREAEREQYEPVAATA